MSELRRAARLVVNAPAIVESIRAGLVFALKEQVGGEAIHRRETELARRALASWSANPRIEILDDGNAERVVLIAGRRQACALGDDSAVRGFVIDGG